MNRVLVSTYRERSAPSVLAQAHERLSLIEAQHRELDARLRELGRHMYLTPSEQVEATDLKKQKLRAKDEIVTLRRALF